MKKLSKIKVSTIHREIKMFTLINCTCVIRFLSTVRASLIRFLSTVRASLIRFLSTVRASLGFYQLYMRH